MAHKAAGAQQMIAQMLTKNIEEQATQQISDKMYWLQRSFHLETALIYPDVSRKSCERRQFWKAGFPGASWKVVVENKSSMN